MNDEGVIRHDMTVARKLVVAVLIFDPLPRVAPVRKFGMPGAHIGNQPRDERIARYYRQADIEQMGDVAGEKGFCLHRGKEHGGVDGFAVVTDSASCFGQSGGKPRLARRDQRPAVNEDLRADLLGDRLSICGDRTGPRSGHPTLEIQPCGVFGRIAVAAPPQNRALLDDRIEPGLADFLGREICFDPVLVESAHESERARDIVVGNYQRHVETVMNVIFDGT
jgi:hypothetical protein